jgi:hypothetical protein
MELGAFVLRGTSGPLSALAGTEGEGWQVGTN